MMRAFACLSCLLSVPMALAAEIPVTPTKLVVVDKLATATKAKTVYVAKDAGATKGAGEDVDQISVRLDVAYANGSAAGAFTIPAGSANGWLANKATVAKYVNKSAPNGPTQAKVAVIKPGKLLKLVGKGLGDTALDILGAGDPAGAVYTAYCVSNGAEENCHCSVFTGCIYKAIAGGAGAKLVCKSGAGAPACSAVVPPPTTSTSTTTSTTLLPCVDVTGCWAGNVDGSISGTWDGNLTQTGQSVQGTINVPPLLANYSVSGSVNCDGTGFVLSDGFNVTFAGVTDGAMASGPWEASLMGWSGTWDATRCAGP